MQEEPANQGAWSFVALNLLEQLGGRAAAARPASPPGGSASPASRVRPQLHEAAAARPIVAGGASRA